MNINSGLELILKAKPLFLIGAPRSGTTLLNQMLNAHPQILLTNETAVFLQLNEIIGKSYKGVRSGILYGKQDHELWAQYLEGRAREMIQEYYGQIAAKENRTSLVYWGEKHPHLFLCLDWLEKHFPEAMYIYLVRDPRDAACSIAQMNNVPHSKSLLNMCNFVRQYEAFAAHLPERQLIALRYEDLIQDYHGQAQKILEKLGLRLSPEVEQFIEKYKDVDAHKVHADRLVKWNFKEISLGRWRKEMGREDVLFADRELGPYLEKYQYERAEQPAGTVPPPALLEDLKAERIRCSPCVKSDDAIEFTCNICLARNRVSKSSLDREKQTCCDCGSSVRTRAVVHLASMELFGRSIPLPKFPVRKDIRGIGLSDWDGYAVKLADKLAYTNTFYDKEPKLDISDIESYPDRDFDFLISSEVFEHVRPPIEKVFQNARSLLKHDGFMILTVPYMLKIKETIEHFPGLHDFSIMKKNGAYILKNIKEDGRVEYFENLKFHGGQGMTLELRIFSYNDLLDSLRNSGFSKVATCGQTCIEYGIYWKCPNALPMVARP